MFWNRGVLSFGNWVGSLRWEYKPRHSFAMGVIVWILKLLLKASSQQCHVRVWSSSESLTKHLVATNSLLLMAPSSSHALSSVKTKTDAYYSIHYSDTNDISKFSPMVSSSTRKILVVPNTVLESDYLCKNSAPSTARHRHHHHHHHRCDLQPAMPLEQRIFFSLYAALAIDLAAACVLTRWRNKNKFAVLLMVLSLSTYSRFRFHGFQKSTGNGINSATYYCVSSWEMATHTHLIRLRRTLSVLKKKKDKP